MRLYAVFLLSLLATPALAADPIAEQAERAYSLFASGLSEPAYLTTGFADKLLAGVAGRWVRLNGPDPKTGIETYGADTDKACKGAAALTLASPSPYTMTLTTNLETRNFSQDYTLVSGATFGEHTDPGPYFAAIGLGPERTGVAADQQRALALRFANGLVQIYRPSEDILVLVRDLGYPTILARCPA